MDTQEPSPDRERWLYFKLYVGQAVDRLDSLILDVGSRLAALGLREGWFFLRYIDPQGVHLRLRVKARDEADESRIRKICEQSLETIPQFPPAQYRPMVLPPGLDLSGTSFSGAVVHLQPDTYEPELDKFGGPAGMPVAETLFEVSSEIAVAVLKDEADGKYSRKTLAPCLMDLVIQAFPPRGSIDSFWRGYSLYWLGGPTPAAEDWRQRFQNKARELDAAGTPVVGPFEELPIEARRLLERWHEALARAAQSYARLPDSAAPQDVLAFNFTHLMNNRLGFMALEEAYLSALLEQRASRVLA